MEINFKNLGSWETEKALYLCQVAKNTLDWDLSGYGICDVNPNSGYTYLWLEDYPVCLYMEINCKLSESDIWVMWTNTEDGEEVEECLEKFGSMNEIYDWVRDLEERREEV